MPKLTLRSAIPAFGILIAIGGCAESPTGPAEPAAVRTPADASAKPAAPVSAPRFGGYTEQGG